MARGGKRVPRAGQWYVYEQNRVAVELLFGYSADNTDNVFMGGAITEASMVGLGFDDTYC
jgi:hypothetical protein